MSWKDIIKAKKISWKEFKRSLPEETTLGSLNDRGRGANLDVIFSSNLLMVIWLEENAKKFGIAPRNVDDGESKILYIPRIRFDEYSPGTKLRAAVENDEWEFEDFESP